jgi:Domain of Unknown Function (DUF1259)
MTGHISLSSVTRRNLLRAGGLIGGVTAGGGLLGGVLRSGAGNAAELAPDRTAASSGLGPLPVTEIEQIINAQGTFTNGVLDIAIARTDIPDVTKNGVPVKPGFEINGDLFFQAVPGGVMMNGDLALKPDELGPAIDAVVRHGLVWEAEHQHLYDLTPMVWFIHLRGHGPARQVAQGCAAVLAATATPLPQSPPREPTTPLDAKRLQRIIGSPASVGSDGVVSFAVPQREPITLGGVRVSPYLNVSTPINFEPLGGEVAACVPDFGMLASQVNDVARVMSGQGWELDCLYNQETDEDPQLYFSHQWKVGNAYQLAAEVRKGLQQTSVVLS